MNILHVTDGYKVYHMEQLPSQVKSIYGNLTARGDKYFQRAFRNPTFGAQAGLLKNVMDAKETPFHNINDMYLAFGMHQALREITQTFNDQFFMVPVDEAIKMFKRDIANYIGYNETLDNNIRHLHSYGRLPITVKTVHEGDMVRMNEPCMIVETTDDRFAWVFGYLEPVITNMVWKTITNATTALEFYKIAKFYGKLTGSDEGAIMFGFHDFSSRGMSGMEDSARNGVPHLLFFNGTESVGALGYINEMYNYDYEVEGMLAGSIKATEHSISTVNIFNNMLNNQTDLSGSEEQFFLDYITKTYPTGMIAYVADTFDFYGFVYDILTKHKDVVNGRDGKVVIRPDSFEDPIVGVLGDLETPFFYSVDSLVDTYIKNEDLMNHLDGGGQVRVLCDYYAWDTSEEADDYALKPVREATPEEAGTLPKLLKEFGFTVNQEGCAVLNPKIGLIYGDGFNLARTKSLFEKLAGFRLATSNIVIGVGGGSYGFVSRDTLGIAYKATSFLHENGEHVDIYKDPKGVNKKSAKGRFLAQYNERTGFWNFHDQVTFEESEKSDWVTIVKDGRISKLPKFSEIRERAKKLVDDNI